MEIQHSPYQAPFIPNDKTVNWIHQSTLIHDSHVEKYEWYRADIMYQIANAKTVPVRGLSGLVAELNCGF